LGTDSGFRELPKLGVCTHHGSGADPSFKLTNAVQHIDLLRSNCFYRSAERLTTEVVIGGRYMDFDCFGAATLLDLWQNAPIFVAISDKFCRFWRPPQSQVIG